MDEDVRRAIQAASGAVGVDFAQYRPAMIQRRLSHRMRLRGCADAREYALLLGSDAAERWRLADAFLIKTTYAFRDARTWRAMRAIALPRLVERCVRRGSTTLSAWVPGCSTGEEAYSYAIALLEARERASVHLDVQVFASDVDVAALERAARGAFPASAFANVPPELAGSYLHERADGSVVVDEAVRRVVSLARHDLTESGVSRASAAVFASFDVVSCCNVMLYFDDRTRRMVWTRLLAACENGGVLVLGEAEYPPPELHRALIAIDEGAHAFNVAR